MWITQLISLGNPCISCRNQAGPHRLTHAVFRGVGKRHHHSSAFRFYPTPVDNVKHPLHVAVFVPLHLPVIAPDRYHADRCANAASVHSALPVDKNSVAKAPEPRPLCPPSRIHTCNDRAQCFTRHPGPRGRNRPTCQCALSPQRAAAFNPCRQRPPRYPVTEHRLP